MPQQKPFLEEIFDTSTEEIKIKVADEQYGELAPFVRKLKDLGQFQGVQARLPYELEIN